MDYKDITFSINLYSGEGDLYDTGLFLHFGESVILKCRNITDLRNMIKQLETIEEEFVSQWSHVLEEYDLI